MLNNIDVAINNHFSKIHILISKQRIRPRILIRGFVRLLRKPGVPELGKSVPRYTNRKVIACEVDFLMCGHTGGGGRVGLTRTDHHA